MSVGGEFTQEASSTVLGSQMDIGYIGPGLYNLRSGTVWLQHVWIGGAYAGKMIQTGGTNAADIVHLEPGGEYTLVDGDFNAANVYFGEVYQKPSLLRQLGGRINPGLTVFQGIYRLEGGQLYGNVLIPPPAGYGSSYGNGTMVQAGGENFGTLQIGYNGGWGTYIQSNGVSRVEEMKLGARGVAEQWYGVQTVAGTLTLDNDWIDRNLRGAGIYELNGGSFSAEAINLDGYFFQNGGNGVVFGDIVGKTVYGGLVVNGGELRSRSVTLMTSYRGGFEQTGGRLVIAKHLTVSRDSADMGGYDGCVLKGGELLVPEIVLTAGATFRKWGGTLAESSLLTVTNGNLYIGAGTHRFGRLSLQFGPARQTNSTMYLPANDSMVLVFADSSRVPWSGNASVTILNWKGSWTGGGQHQIFIGSSAFGLSETQLAQVLFRDPLGFSPGLYQARILQTGEVVPDALPPTGRTPPTLAIVRQSEGTVQITVRGDSTANYGIDISSNLFNWTRWTNVATVEGAATVLDPQGIGTARFYRAVLLP